MHRSFLIGILLLGTLTGPALADGHPHERRWQPGSERHLKHERREHRRNLRHDERRAWRHLRRERLHDDYRPPHGGYRPHPYSRRWYPPAHHAHLHGHRTAGHWPPPHRAVYGVHDRHGVDPLPIIGGGVIGGVLGNELGQGDPGATATGLFIGSLVGYELGRH